MSVPGSTLCRVRTGTETGSDDDRRAALLAKRAETDARLSGLDASFADIVESSRDSNLDDEHDTEGTTIAASREQISALAKAARSQLQEIDSALQRVEEGTYGRCLRCGGQISDGRLEARPTATDCITCARGA